MALLCAAIKRDLLSLYFFFLFFYLCPCFGCKKFRQFIDSNIHAVFFPSHFRFLVFVAFMSGLILQVLLQATMISLS